MKIRKFIEFINEEFNDTPESYIETALKQLQKKIGKMFEDQVDIKDQEKEGNISIMKAKGKGKSKKLSFKELGVQLESSEISKYFCDSVSTELKIVFTWLPFPVCLTKMLFSINVFIFMVNLLFQLL